MEKTRAWDRMKEEPMRQYQWFQMYLSLGPSRSINKAYTESQKLLHKEVKGIKASRHWTLASRTWDWVERSMQFDIHQQEQITETHGVKVEKLRERQLAVAQKMLDKMDEMLQFPVAQQRSQDGKTIISPGKWTFSTVAQMARAAQDIMEPKGTSITLPPGAKGVVSIGDDMSQMTDAMLESIARSAGERQKRQNDDED